MSSTSLYRSNAEHCLRMATSAPDERDRPFWLTMAQSWLHLAECAARNSKSVNCEFETPPLGREA
jgi:hypothetical protein